MDIKFLDKDMSRKKFLTMVGAGILSLSAFPKVLFAGDGDSSLTKSELSERLVHQDPIEIKRLLESDSLNYCIDYIRLIDEHLKDRLGESMRKHLEELRIFIEREPSKFIEKRINEVNSSLSITP